ncbi:unnamed protein product [Cuscuta campestris]|uniref:DUF4408 domain-containing protein n=1 Tax=Cuscuta campestris TaxID=132261 RepID=A0A484K3Q2_9ASTE|nr:unnamed protein product [Cuscuta campestris]
MSFKVIFSVSVLSLALSQFCNPLFLAEELPFSFSSSFSFINQLLFRFSSSPNYVFLFCNGILVLIITNSGHFPGSQPPEKSAGSIPLQLHQEGSIFQEDEEGERAGQDESIIPGAHPDHQHHHRKEDDQEEEEDDAEDEDMELVVLGGGEHHESGGEEEEEDGRSDRLSDEEWDKKFDEFIKKMKQDFIIYNK